MQFDDKVSPGGEQAAARLPAVWAAFAASLAAKFFPLQNRSDVHGRYKPTWMRTPDPVTGKVMPSYTAKRRLTPLSLAAHFAARCRGDLVGLHVSSPEETCRWVVVDLDAHGDADDPGANWKMAQAAHGAAKGHGFDALLLDSNGRGGYHLWIVFASPVSMADAWRLGRWLVRDFAAFGLAKGPEVFPKSPRLSGKRIGNWVRLPGRHHTRDHWTRVWDGEQWLEGEPAIRAILGTTGRDVDIAAVIPPDFDPRGRRVFRRRCNIALALAPEPSGRRVDAARAALGHLGVDYRDDYDAWLRVGMALRQLGEPGLALWHEWSEPSDKYRPEVLDEKWAGFAPEDEGTAGGQLTLGSLFHWAHQEGWPGPSLRSDKKGIQGSFTTPVKPLGTSGEERR